jgi:hypothetical protein
VRSLDCYTRGRGASRPRRTHPEARLPVLTGDRAVLIDGWTQPSHGLHTRRLHSRLVPGSQVPVNRVPRPRLDDGAMPGGEGKRTQEGGGAEHHHRAAMLTESAVLCCCRAGRIRVHVDQLVGCTPRVYVHCRGLPDSGTYRNARASTCIRRRPRTPGDPCVDSAHGCWFFAECAK